MFHRVHSYSTSHNLLDLYFILLLPFCDKILGYYLSTVSLLPSSIQSSENTTFSIDSVARHISFHFPKLYNLQSGSLIRFCFFGTNSWFSYLLFVRVYIRLNKFGDIQPPTNLAESGRFGF
jgi:hypothetical protein